MTAFSHTATRALVGFAGITVGALLCFGAAATPAQARNNDRLPTVNVSYADLDLENVAGRRHLDRRLHSAAHQVCALNATGAGQISAEQKCMTQALANVRLPAVR